MNRVLSALISYVINQAGGGQLVVPSALSDPVSALCQSVLSIMTCSQTEIRQSPGYVELNNLSQTVGFFAGLALHSKLKPLTSDQ